MKSLYFMKFIMLFHCLVDEFDFGIQFLAFSCNRSILTNRTERATVESQTLRELNNGNAAVK